MPWTKHMSRKYKQYYWFNSETNESVWKKPIEKPIERQKIIKTETNKLKEKIKIEINKPKENTFKITKKDDDFIGNYFRNNEELKEYKICNYNNNISGTITAIDKYDAMEQMRDLAQSLNPYD